MRGSKNDNDKVIVTRGKFKLAADWVELSKNQFEYYSGSQENVLSVGVPVR